LQPKFLKMARHACGESKKNGRSSLPLSWYKYFIQEQSLTSRSLVEQVLDSSTQQ